MCPQIDLWINCFVMALFAPYSVCTTITQVTIRWQLLKLVDKVWSTVFNRNFIWVFATAKYFTKANRSVHLTIFHGGMSTIQPTWESRSTSVSWNTRCWRFSSCCSHKTIPSLKELIFTQRLGRDWYVDCISAGITQVIVIITWFSCRDKR